MQNWLSALAKAASHRWDGEQRKRQIIQNLSQTAEMCGHHWQKLFTSHFFGTSSSVNRLQPSFVTEVVGGKKLLNNWKTPAKASISTTFGHWLTNSNEPPKQTRKIQPVPFSYFSRRAAATHSPSGDGEMSKSDRMERKLEKEWEITRCLWKTPHCYVPPSSH